MTNKDIKKYDKENLQVDPVTGLLKSKLPKYMKGQPTKKSAVAFCHNKVHKGYLTINMVKQHKCQEKQCKYFSKYQDNPYWKEKTIKKIIKKVINKLNKGNHNFIKIKGHKHQVKERERIEALIRKYEVTDISEVEIVDSYDITIKKEQHIYKGENK